MKPIEKRERLFRHSRPNLREFTVYDGDEYHKDFKILWVAHQKQKLAGIKKGSEKDLINTLTERDAEMLIIEDENAQFKGFGPIGVFWIYTNGWKMEPHVSFFPWATNRNKLRSSVAFLQWARNSRKIGCVLMIIEDRWRNLTDRICSYGVLHYVGKVRNGLPSGDEFIYSVKGKKRS